MLLLRKLFLLSSCLREYYLFELADINPKSDEIKDEFIYIDLECVDQGMLCQQKLITKIEAPSRAQRTVRINDILYQTVRPYQKNNYIMKEAFKYQVVASTGYALLRPKINPIYLYYLLHSKKINDEVISRCTGTSFPAISPNDLKVIKCVIHNEEVQKNIGKILYLLDKRISSQKKIINKYESLIFSIYNELLSNKQNVKLGNICEINKGTQLNAENFDSTGVYPVINGGISISGYTNNYNCKNKITISEGGNSCGYVNFMKNEFWSGGHNYTLVKKSDFDYDYLFHYLKYREKEIMSLRVGSGLPNIQKSSLTKFLIYLPDISIQRQYSQVLNTISQKINIEKSILQLYLKEKEYLLSKLFI